jgi:hypothetical protein
VKAWRPGAAAVELGEGEDVADGLIAETEAAAFLFGQALGEDVGVEGSELEAAGGAGGGAEAVGEALEPQIVVAVSFEAFEEGLGGGVEAFGPFERVAPEEDVEGAFFLLEKVAEVFFEVGGDLVQGGKRRRSFIGLEEGDEFGGEAEGAGKGGLGKAQIGAGFFEFGAKDPLHM